MSTQAIPLSKSRWRMEEDQEVIPTATTVSYEDLVLFSHPALNPAYTLVFGVIASSPPLEAKRPVKYVLGQRTSIPGAQYSVPWFDAGSEQFELPATIVSLSDWPEMREHPERLKAAFNLAGLIAHFDQGQMADWAAFVDSFCFFIGLHATPLERFRELAKAWKTDVRFLSDTNEICSHPAYQEIVGMGILALPFIFAELEREPDNWFWALKAITGRDPVPENQRGNLELMTKAWLGWAEGRRKQLGADWQRVFLRFAP
ncbi:MAG TPA: hypothetical protein VMF08_13390 [Candidatus Sulfotelmatobacter sp.]|nr:hypothetical protein [Candidatus Sulfotelmatobacter sp.]